MTEEVPMEIGQAQPSVTAFESILATKKDFRSETFLPSSDELGCFLKENKISQSATSAFIVQQKVFPNRGPDSGYAWQWVFKSWKGRLNANRVIKTLAYLTAKGVSTDNIDWDNLAAFFFNLLPHQHSAADIKRLTELSEATAHYSPMLRAAVEDFALASFWEQHTGQATQPGLPSAVRRGQAQMRPIVGQGPVVGLAGRPEERPFKATRKRKTVTYEESSQPDSESDSAAHSDMSVDPDEECLACGSPERGKTMLMCDGCNKGLHMHCLRPRVSRIPSGKWYCPKCTTDQSASAPPDPLQPDQMETGGEMARAPGNPAPRVHADIADGHVQIFAHVLQRAGEPKRLPIELTAIEGGATHTKSITAQQADTQAQVEIATIVQQQPFRAQTHRLARALLPVDASNSAALETEVLPVLEQAVSSLSAADALLLEAGTQTAGAGLSLRGTSPTGTVIKLSAQRAQHLISQLHETASTGGDYEALAAEVCNLLALDYAVAKAGSMGRVKEVVSFPIRVKSFAQRLQGFAANTWKQYWPKLSNMVRWLKANRPSTGQTVLISEATFMAYMDDLNSGVFRDSGHKVKRGSETEEIRAIGLQTFKQYLSAAMHLQLCQEFMLYGDQISPPLTQGLCLKWALKHHKQNENQRKQDNLVDAAANAPEMLSDETMMQLAEIYLDREDRKSFVAGVRELAIDRHTLSTMGRGDEARQKRICQQIPFDYPAATEHEPGVSRQTLWATAYSMDFGKMNAGDGKDYQIAARHNNVFNCPLSAMALQNIAKAHMAGIPLPDITGGKKEWYTDLIFAVGTKAGKLQASQQYDHIRRAQRLAGIRKTGVISHLNRHVAAVQARVLYSESIAEVAVAGNWRVDILSGVYAQVGSADSIAHRAGYSSRAAVGNFRQLLSPLDWSQTAAIVEALFPGLGEHLEAMQEYNASCSADDKDLAGEFVLELYMRDAVIFLQDMPFWHEKFPDLRLWKIPALAPFWTAENPVLVQWMNLQRAFVGAMEQQRTALARPFSGSLANVRAELVNAYMAQLDLDGDFASTVKMAEQAASGADSISCREIAQPLKVLGSRNAKYSLSAMPTPAMGRVRAAQPGSPLSVQPRTASQLALTPSDGTDSWRPGPGVRSPHSVSQAPVRRSRRAPQQTASEASLPSIAEEEQHATADALLELASDPSHGDSAVLQALQRQSMETRQLTLAVRQLQASQAVFSTELIQTGPLRPAKSIAGRRRQTAAAAQEKQQRQRAEAVATGDCSAGPIKPKWQRWEGIHFSLDQSTLLDLWEDWQDGILLRRALPHLPEVRRESMKQLEESMSLPNKKDCIAWRQGAHMRTEVYRRKTLLYALLDAMDNCPGTSSQSVSSKLAHALESMAELQQSVGEELALAKPTRKRKDGTVPPCSLLQLVDHLSKLRNNNEYEVANFGWQNKHPKGNPKKGR